MKRKKINWKKQLAKERFFLRNGRMPTSVEVEKIERKPKEVKLMFGFNTAPR
jgi:hypothetical protein